MQKFQGYEEVEVNFDYEKLELGGHICKILGVEIETFNSKKDGKQYQNLKIKFDLEKPDAQSGYYGRKFEMATKQNVATAKWKGYFKVSIPQDDSADFIKTAFKRFTTSIEHSNKGYKWNWEENTLIGKVFGGVFGLEELTLPDGKVIAFARCRFIRSTTDIEKVEIPKVKLLDGTYVDYDDYMERKEEENEKLGKALEENVANEDNDDLPF